MSESQVLKRLDFPAYCVRVLDNGLVAIAGGGGTSKTGVGNSIELGLVNYSTVDAGKNHAQFQSIHTFEPQDAVMKFTSFTVDRCNAATERSRIKTKEEHNSNMISKPEFDASKSDLYIAACVHSAIEIYNVHPIIDKHSTQLTTKRTRTNSNSNSTSGPPPPPTQTTNTARNRKNSQRKNSLTTSAKEVVQSNNLSASANLILCKSIHIDQIRINEDEHDMTVSEPESRTKEQRSGLSKSLNTANYDDESIDVLTVCQVKVKAPKSGQVVSSRNLLCAGTSKGSICVWEMLFTATTAKVGNEAPMRCVKVKVLREAHGTQEVDDIQVNAERSQLLTIGKDNRCIVWSLTPRVEKFTELEYLQMLGDSNLRMKHARFAQNGACLYTTYIPRSRGGGRSMTSYLQRWSCGGTESGYRVVKTHKVRNTVITCVQASKDGECVVCGDYEGQIYLFDANFNKLINFKKQHSSVVTDLAFYHDSTLAYNSNKLILSLSIDRTLQCYTYLDTSSSLTRRLGLTNTPSSLDKLSRLAGRLADKLQLFSINTFRLFLVVWLAVLLFCYFFTHFEAS